VSVEPEGLRDAGVSGDGVCRDGATSESCHGGAAWAGQIASCPDLLVLKYREGARDQSEAHQLKPFDVFSVVEGIF